MKISVVMPVLDEEARIGVALEQFDRLPGDWERIVVDGGSRDATAMLARRSADRVIIAPGTTRSAAMNLGARAATGEALLFLHADVTLPTDAADHMAAALAEAGVVAGAFRTWTVCEGGAPAWKRALVHGADLRSRLSRLPYGDQGIFLRAEVFRRSGGFPKAALMEDLLLSRRLRSHGRIRTVPASVEVSARRFESGLVRSFLAMNLIPLFLGLGAPPRLLRLAYGHAR